MDNNYNIDYIEKRKLLILSVADCNMRCEYCFIRNKIDLKLTGNHEVKRYIKEILLETKKYNS